MPERGEKTSKGLIKHYEEHPETREKISRAVNKALENPEYKQKLSISHQGKRSKVNEQIVRELRQEFDLITDARAQRKFCRTKAPNLSMTPAGVKAIVLRRTWTWVV